MNRTTISSGAPWERTVGYSRAVRVGDRVFVAGTTATNTDGTTAAVDDAYGQTKHILTIIGAALEEAGASFADVVRTRVFITDIARWEDVGRAHGEVFGDIRPASTMVEVSRLVSPDHLVEIEVDAIVGSAAAG